MADTSQNSHKPSLGRRERKKAATRKRISDVATEMFIERGFDAVSVREIADRVDVSPTTVFTYFPQKEALVFDEDESIGEELLDIIKHRGDGVTVAEALHSYFVEDVRETQSEHGDKYRQFSRLVDETPALREYAQRAWLRYESIVAKQIASEAGLDRPTPEMEVFAGFVLQLHSMASRTSDPIAMLDAGFDILANGWHE